MLSDERRIAKADLPEVDRVRHLANSMYARAMRPWMPIPARRRWLKGSSAM